MQILTKLEQPTGPGFVRERFTKIAIGARGAGRAIAGFIWGSVVLTLALVMKGFENVQRNGARRRRMRVVETLALGGRRQLVLVMCDEQEYLVGMGVEGVETIVLRQPGVAVPVPSAPGVPAQVPAQAVGVKNRVGTMLRDRAVPGPWLVTAGGKGIAENRIREAGSGTQNGAQGGMGQELWQ